MKAHLLFTSLILPVAIFAQSSCPNMDFENGNFGNWSGSYGCNPYNIEDYEIYYDQNSCSYPLQSGNYVPPRGNTLDQPNASNVNNLNGQQSIVTSNWNGGVDPYIPALSLTPPTGGNAVARIGDYYNGARAGDLNYTLTVDSNNSLLTAYYAIVLEAPGGDHQNDQNPYFRIRLLDPDGNSVECVEYIQDGVAGAEGFNTYNCGGRCVNSQDGNRTDRTFLIWRDWTAISVNLLPYYGQEVTVEFVAGDCALVGHLGYAYIDVACRRNEILVDTSYVCQGVNANFSAPDGMSDYEWHYGDTLGPIVGTSQTLSTSDTGFYYCTMTPFSNAISSCPFTLGTYIRQAPSLPAAGFTAQPSPVCLGEAINFTDTSITANNSPLASWSWNFGDGTSSSAQNPSHTYGTDGIYTVQLAIETVDGCLDTAEIDVEVLPLLNPEITVPALVCSADSAFDLQATPANGIFSGIGITDSIAGTFDPILASSLGASPYTISYSVGTCNEVATANINVTPQDTADFLPAGPFCEDDAPFQLIAQQSGGVWSGNGVDANGLFNPAAASIGSNIITYTFNGDCGDVAEQTIVVNPRADASITPVNPICESDAAIQLIAAEAGGVWSGNGVDVNGSFNPATAGVGIHQVIYSIASDCPDADTIIIEVVKQAIADFVNAGPFCEDDAPFQLIAQQIGGTWSGNGVDANGIFNPAAASIGNNTITYSIGGLCADEAQEIIVVNPRADASITPVNPICESDAAIQLSAAEVGGEWSGNGVDVNGSFDPATAGVGIHQVIYSITGDCPDADTINIEVVDQANPEFIAAGPFCINDASIQLQAVQAGGTWSGNGVNGNGMFFPSVAGAGVHAITYTIAGLCGDSFTDSIEVIALPEAKINPINPLCFNSADVQLSATQAGGVWSGDVDASGVFSATSAGPGTYKAVYSFTGVCNVADSIEILVTEPLSITDSSKNASCKDLCDGSIELFVEGGFTNAPYNFIWSNGATNSPNNNNLCDGIYTVTVSDLYACTDSLSIEITEPDSLLYRTEVDSATCQQYNGIAQVVDVTGGTPPYFYAWSNGVQTANNPNIAPGDYEVEVTDSRKCLNIDTAFVGNVSGPSFTVLNENAECFGESNGYAIIENLSGGIKPYTIQWSTGLSDEYELENLAAGAYSVLVTGSTGCSEQKFFNITQPNKAASILPVSTLCTSNTPIQIQVTQPGGTFSGNGVDSLGLFNPGMAGEGVHQIIYSQGLPCPDADTINIEVIETATPEFSNIGPFCSSVDSVAFENVQDGGVWTGFGVDENGNFFPSQVGPGRYFIKYTISGLCGANFGTLVEVLPQSDAGISGPESICPKEAPVQLIPNQSGGYWLGDGVNDKGIFNPSLVNDNDTAFITYIIPGLCPDTGRLSIFVKRQLEADFAPVAPLCDDLNPIVLKANDLGGVWSGNGIVDTLNGIFDPKVAGEGLHSIQYVIAGACGAMAIDTIEVKPRIVADILPVDPICFNSDIVSIIATEEGGTWSGDVDDIGIFNPKTSGPGTFKAIYAYAGTCPSADTINILVTEKLIIADSMVNVSCNGLCDGEAFLDVTGGFDEADYNFTWSNSDQINFNQSFNLGLCASDFSVVVQDKYGCTDSVNLSITEPQAIDFDVLVDSASCNQNNGSVKVVNISGGTQPYNYMWNTGANDTRIDNIGAGSYTFSLSDNNNCKADAQAIVGDRKGPKFDISSELTSCFGASDGSASVSNISGGTAPFIITWSTSKFFNKTEHSDLNAGSYSVNVKDATGCEYNENFNIDQPTKVKLDAFGDTTLCLDQSTTISALATGGTPDYFYVWNGNVTTSNTLSVNQASLNTVFALDNNQCPSDTQTVNIDFYEPLEIDATPSDTTICEGEPVTLFVNVSGGTGNYSILWEDGATENRRAYNPAGKYGDTIRVNVNLSDMCSPDVQTEAVITFFAQPQPAFEAFPTEGCEPLVVQFDNQSTNAVKYSWDLGDGTTSNDTGNFSHVYSQGVYDVLLNVVSADGCKAELLKTKYITTYDSPVADFTFQPDPITLQVEEIQFIDKSLGQVNSWAWTFTELDSSIITNSNEENPIVAAPKDAGSYIAKLVVTNVRGCIDSIYKTFDVEPDFSIYVPNAYTPNGDGVNEVFTPVLRGIQKDHYRLNIYDRWGELIWFTEDPNESWDGSMTRNPSILVKTDVYVWQISARDYKSIPHEFVGHVTLLK